jgi:hypothetical protein
VDDDVELDVDYWLNGRFSLIDGLTRRTKWRTIDGWKSMLVRQSDVFDTFETHARGIRLKDVEAVD